MTLHRFDLSSQRFKANPFPTFAEMRAAGPMLRMKLPLVGKCWVTTTYEAADTVLRDNDRFCTDATNAGHQSKMAVLGIISRFLPRSIRSLAQNMLTMDEPDHRRLRSLVESAFVRQSVEEMRPGIERIVEEQLDALEQAADRRGRVDFLRGFARRVPLAVICELLGLPTEDRDKFEKWCAFGNASGLLSMLWGLRGIGKLRRYLLKQFDDCRRRPRPGMMSALVQVEQDGDKLNEDELFASVMVLLVAGHETTTHLITVGLWALEHHPEAKAHLLADWTQAEAAVDEMLRYNSTIQFTKPRYARATTQVCGVRLERGEFCLPMLAAANCDPAAFEHPETFDIGRAPNPHMAFGRGIHVCLGLKLAKAEAAIAFERLYERFPQLSLVTTADTARWTSRIGLRSLRELNVQFAER